MTKLSWAAVIAAVMACVAILAAILDRHETGIVVGLAAITFALLSHRDE